MSMTPLKEDGSDQIQQAARELFINHLRAQDPVRKTFFPMYKPHRYEELVNDDSFDFEYFSTLYVSQAICGNKDEFGIHKMLDEAKIKRRLDDIHCCPDWKKIGRYLLIF